LVVQRIILIQVRCGNQPCPIEIQYLVTGFLYVHGPGGIYIHPGPTLIHLYDIGGAQEHIDGSHYAIAFSREMLPSRRGYTSPVVRVISAMYT
jgi:hypothetical protein